MEGVPSLPEKKTASEGLDFENHLLVAKKNISGVISEYLSEGRGISISITT